MKHTDIYAAGTRWHPGNSPHKLFKYFRIQYYNQLYLNLITDDKYVDSNTRPQSREYNS